jgi:hypothetical protein
LFEKEKYVSVLDQYVFNSKGDAYQSLIDKCHSSGLYGGSVVTLKKVEDGKYIVLKIEGKTVFNGHKKR